MATGKGKRKKRGLRSVPDNPAQSKRFMEAAKKLGLDESGKDFEKAVLKIIPPKKGKKGGSS
jgi:hypothetical protein